MMLTMHGPLLDVQILDPVEWIPASTPPLAGEGQWSPYVLAETSEGRLFFLAYCGSEGPWQRPRGTHKGEVVVRWAHIERRQVLASDAEWVTDRLRPNPST